MDKVNIICEERPITFRQLGHGEAFVVNGYEGQIFVKLSVIVSSHSTYNTVKLKNSNEDNEKVYYLFHNDTNVSPVREITVTI